MENRFTKIEKDVHELKSDYHSFKEAYTKNGVELKRLATAIEFSQRLDDEQNKKIDAMFEIYQNTGWTFKMMLAISGFIGITTGAVLGLIKLFK